jgi:hypothetical protein
MIIDIEPGSKVKVPTKRDFIVRTATSFDPGELVAVVPVLEYARYDGASGEINGTVDTADFLFPIVPGLFTPGEWTVNFRAVVSGKTRGWPQPAILDFGDPLAAGCENGC